METYERKNIGLLRPFLPECMVLLKRNGRFPLDGPCRIAAYGSGARYTVKGGTGSGEVNSRYFVTVEQGLREAGFDVVCDEWAYQYGQYTDHAKQRFTEEIKAKARRDKLSVFAASMGTVMKAPEYHIPMDMSCDAAAYIVSRISGEGNDRLAEKGDFMLTDSEVRDILKLDAGYERFMLVINTGGPVDLSSVMSVGNILVMSQLGVESGVALADVLLGKAYPSGRLTTSWAKYSDYCSEGGFGCRDDTEYREGIYVGYRYFDSFGKEPLFPFGFGLGYTDFERGRTTVKAEGPEIRVSARISNTGAFRGKETLQVYLSCPHGRLDRELKSLAGFAKTGELGPGEGETLRVSFDIREHAGFDQSSGSYILEKGDYIVLAGTGDGDIRPVKLLRLEEDYTVSRPGRLFGDTAFKELRPEAGTDPRSVFGISRMKPVMLDLSKCSGCERHGTGNGSLRAEDAILANMKARDLAYLNIGTFNKSDILPGVVGDSAQSVAGAAGESTDVFADAGIGSLIMSDGPAGIRIAGRYYEDKKGKHAVGLPVPESTAELLPGIVRWYFDRKSRPPEGAEIKEQYCTALPIATAIAQSWNTEFAELCGDIVGAEMDIFGIDLWLAPAMNIHRNVLCGRNFEYFSEDPLISGSFAAALTKGVQKHPGRGVTLKHFAANNQETNRYASNSVVGERALREIYLRGFGICIREADPMAVMTSYNLLNGTHTSESRALTDILRDEFGFDGLIMTDWIVGGDSLIRKGSKYGVPDPAKVATAGCSLFMPGGRGDHRSLLKGFRAGRVSEARLRENAGWLLHVMSRLGRL